MEETMIRVSNACKTLGEYRFGPVNLEVNRGYIYTIVGPNGSGKSTLFRLLLGLLQPEQGQIDLFGKPMRDSFVSGKQKIGYVPEKSETIVDEMTGSQYAAFQSRWYPRWNTQLFDRLLQKYEVDPSLKLGRMSKGNRRKLELTASLACCPELLLWDEPSSGLDPFVWKMMMDDIRLWMEPSNRSLLMATHSMDEVRRLADYVVFMYKGRILGVFEKDALIDHWKTYWVAEGQIEWSNIPGVTECRHQSDGNAILISGDAHLTETYLQEIEVRPTRTQSMELDDILLQLIRLNQDNRKRREG